MFRSRGSVVLAAIVIVLAAVLAVSALVVGWPPSSAVAFAAVGWGAWVLYVRPCVILYEDAVELRNVARDVTIPYGAIDDIDTRFQLNITARGRTYRAWALPAPSGGRAKRISDVREGQRPGDSPSTLSGAAALRLRQAVAGAERTDAPVIQRASALVLGGTAAIAVLLLVLVLLGL